MSKINIETILENKNNNELIKNNVKGIINNNKINYLEDNIKVSIILDNNVVIKRIDDEKEIILEFVLNKNTKCLYNIYGKQLKLNIYTNNVIIEDNYIEIDYTIEENNMNFKLYIK